MKKRFIIVIDSLDKDLNDKIKTYVDDNKFAWWHWIDNLWLIVTHDEDITALSIRNDLDAITKNHKVVFQSYDDTWAGYGPSGEKKNMFNWLKDTWSTK